MAFTAALGEMIAEQKKTVGLAKGTRGQFKGRDSSGGAVVEPPERKEIPLFDVGIDKKLSALPHYEAEARKRQGTRTDKNIPEKIPGSFSDARDHAARDFKVTGDLPAGAISS